MPGLGLFCPAATLISLEHGQLIFKTGQRLTLNEPVAIKLAATSQLGQRRSVACRVFPHHCRYLDEDVCYFACLLSPLPFRPLNNGKLKVRQNERLDCFLPVYGLSLPIWSGRVHDLSLGGLRVQSSYIMGPGQRWPIRIRTEDEQIGSICVETKVVWAIGEWAGLKFLHPAPETQQQLVQLQSHLK